MTPRGHVRATADICFHLGKPVIFLASDSQIQAEAYVAGIYLMATFDGKEETACIQAGNNCCRLTVI